MESTIQKQIGAADMVALFNSGKINIRYFNALDYDKQSTNDMNMPFLYEITIRHSEDENPDTLIEAELRNQFEKEIQDMENDLFNSPTGSPFDLKT